MVRGVGVEPTSLAAPGPKPGASANSASRASLGLDSGMKKDIPEFRSCCNTQFSTKKGKNKFSNLQNLQYYVVCIIV